MEPDLEGSARERWPNHSGWAMSSQRCGVLRWSSAMRWMLRAMPKLDMVAANQTSLGSRRGLPKMSGGTWERGSVVCHSLGSARETGGGARSQDLAANWMK